MDTFLQIWGGGCYLANKILFSLGESRRGSKERKMKTYGWVIYLLGVPAWVLILAGRHDWIAASIETGGIPSMVFGLANVLADRKKINKCAERVTSYFTYAFIILGVGFSIADHGGIVSTDQILEVLVTVGFLMGSFLLAARRKTGWLFFMLMNLSMGTLMLRQGKPLLAVQQALSLGFVIWGLINSRKRD